MIVAARDIRPFETIIIDRPAIIGPFDDTLPECLECYKEVSVDGYKVGPFNINPVCRLTIIIKSVTKIVDIKLLSLFILVQPV